MGIKTIHVDQDETYKTQIAAWAFSGSKLIQAGFVADMVHPQLRHGKSALQCLFFWMDIGKTAISKICFTLLGSSLTCIKLECIEYVTVGKSKNNKQTKKSNANQDGGKQKRHGQKKFRKGTRLLLQSCTIAINVGHATQ